MKRKWFTGTHVFIISALTAFAGCYKPSIPPEIQTPESYSPISASNRRLAGYSVEKRALMYITLGSGQDCSFILASIHGDESAGTPLAEHLIKHLEQNPSLLEGHKVVILPVANPDGVAKKRRYNANSVDLNRNFDSQNRINKAEFGFMPLSEPESRIISKLISQYAPSRIVSMHQPLSCIDYDGAGRQIAEHMAQYCDLPVKKLGAMPGSLGSYAGITLGIPIITFEMRQEDSFLSTEMLWQKYGNALLAAVIYPYKLEQL